jgi:hypothetical protein
MRMKTHTEVQKDIADMIRGYSTSQKDMWRTIPHLWINAHYQRGYRTGVCADPIRSGTLPLHNPPYNGKRLPFSIDLSTGNIGNFRYFDYAEVNGYNIPQTWAFRHADDISLCRLADAIEAIDADALVRRLEEDIDKDKIYPTHHNGTPNTPLRFDIKLLSLRGSNGPFPIRADEPEAWEEWKAIYVAFMEAMNTRETHYHLRDMAPSIRRHFWQFRKPGSPKIESLLR